MEKLYIERIKNLLTDSLRALEINDENFNKEFETTILKLSKSLEEI